MTDQWTDRLSDYLDGELPAAERLAIEAHLAVCPACGAVLEDLRRVVAGAGALPDTAPKNALWPAIAERIGAARPGVGSAQRRWRRRFTLSGPQLAAAAVALMAVSAGSVWLAQSRPPAMPMAATAPPPGLVAPVRQVDATYDLAVRDLQRMLDQGRGRLDTATVRVLEQNLRVIDAAIVECRRALAADPASPYLNAHLAQTMKQKLELLRQAARLAAPQA